jgi:phospholipase C
LALSDIKTIVFCMMENRSFDHALGYLGLDGSKKIEGLQSAAAWQDGWTNLDAEGKPYALTRLTLKDPIGDPPHGNDSIKMQIDTRARNRPAMGGFVQAYIKYVNKKKAKDYTPGAVMGYYDAESVPAFDFFARNYCVCDHWFSALPLGTQANRLMAMAGESKILDNETGLPPQRLVYDWLKGNGVKWRAYQSGGYFPFFTLMDKWAFQILGSMVLSGGNFRRYRDFKADWQNMSKTMPPVVFIEPEYSDGPHSKPNDDHPPTSIAPGQIFLRDIYETLIGNPERWASTLLVITYDEHGGFFDHVPPIKIPGKAKDTTFDRSGPRVPAFLISPFVEAGSVFSRDLDHTSFLELLAERFTPGHGYSIPVNDRQGHLTGRIAMALRGTARAGDPPHMPALPEGWGEVSAGMPDAPNTPNAVAIDRVARKLKRERPDIYSHPDMGEVRAYIRQGPTPAPLDKDHIE